MVKFLITRPNHDIVTSYLFYWSKKILDFASKNSIDFIDLRGNKVNKENVESYLKKQNPKLVFFNGHGNDNYIAGFKDKLLIESGKNEELLKNKIIYSLSCNSAKLLGREAVKKGAETFIGYEDSFMLYTDSEREANPIKDKIANSFLQPSNELSISLLKKKTAGESSIISKKAFKIEIEKFSASNSVEGGEMIIMALLWDMENQIVLGNKEARF